MSIPFNQPSIEGREFEAMAEAVANGHVSGDGPFSRRAAEMLQELLGAPRVLLTTSCTHALEMAAILCDIGPGDEVIVPAFTFVSGVNAFVMRGAIPRFADVDSHTFNIDTRTIEPLLTERTRVIAPVHYAGIACDTDAIMRIAATRNVSVVEDAAHALFARYRGRPLGTFGRLGALSFHETKNIHCGEGGALIINDASLIDRAEVIREKGTNRSRFFRGQIDKYTWVDIGSSYLPSDLLAAYLVAQLEAAERIQSKRRKVWETYAAALAGWAANNGVRLPVVPPDNEQPYHMFYLLMPSLPARSSLIERLRSRGITAVFHYLPLNLSPMGASFGARPGQCPVAEGVSDRLLRLPFYNSLAGADQERVIEAILDWRC